MTSNGYTSPQYIGCDRHVLDIILKHSMNEKLSMETTKRSLNYKFIDELKNSYEDLKTKHNSTAHPFKDTKCEDWRDDFGFLFHLSQCHKFYKVIFLYISKILIYRCQKSNLSLCPI